MAPTRPGSSSSSSVPSLPPPSPKSPPQYPDLYGKRREMAKVQMLDREISFLQEELKSTEGLQPASKCCKEMADYVLANSDPLIPTHKKHRRRRQFWKWLCGLPCCKLSWICCCCDGGCSIHLEIPPCCNCYPCKCQSPKCQCCSCPTLPKCSNKCSNCPTITQSCCCCCCYHICSLITRPQSCCCCECSCKWKCPKINPCCCFGGRSSSCCFGTGNCSLSNNPCCCLCC